MHLRRQYPQNQARGLHHLPSSNPNNFTTIFNPSLYTATFWNTTPPAGFNPKPSETAPRCETDPRKQPGYRCDDYDINLKDGIKTFIKTDGSGKNRSENAPVPYLGFSTVPGNITVTHSKHRYYVPSLTETFPFRPDYDPRTQYDPPYESLPILNGSETYTVRWVAWTTDVTKAGEFVLESATGEIIISANPLRAASEVPLVLMSVPDFPTDNGSRSSFSNAGSVMTWIIGSAVGFFSVYLIM
ncbi:hypothetical protein HK104_003106 [Borealophlyctis nickersoniae]|nr:hypothetical protein HK104_003106 [Borealophlyctis nickersoniae]